MNLTKLGLYTFEVSPEVSKLQIAKLIKDKFNVDVISIKTVNIAGKKKMQKARRRHYYTKDIRKAIVQIGKGQKIALFEAGAPEEEVATEPKVKEKKSLLRGTKVKIEAKEGGK